MTVATPTKTPEVLARKDGECRLCPEPIRSGEDYITKVERYGWVHGKCAGDLRRHQELFEQLNDDNDGVAGASEET